MLARLARRVVAWRVLWEDLSRLGPFPDDLSWRITRKLQELRNFGASGGSGDAGNPGTFGDSGDSALIRSLIFVVFRDCITRATGIAARRAEPSFSLAGALLSRVPRLYRKTDNRKKSTKNCYDAASLAGLARKKCFFIPGC